MSMEDILKVLVDSRQQGSSTQAADPMASLVGSLLGGTPQGGQPQGGQPSGLGELMGVLESVMSSGGQGAANDPIMALLTPFITPLAKKANISPEIAMIVVSFVAHKLLAHHPTSGRDSNSFNLDELFGQMADGQINSNLLQSSGMVRELSQKTGLDEATAAKSLDLAFVMVGKGAGSLLKRSASQSSAAGSAPAGSSGGMQGLKTGAKSGAAKKPRK